MPEYTTRVDEVSPTVIYLGKAAPGSSVTAPVWQVKKIEIIGTELIITYPDGVDTFNSVWNSRASYTYQ